MNLAFCLFNYFPFGGLQRDFIRIAEACLRRGHTIDVYTMRWDGPNTLNLPIHILPVRGLQNHTRIKHFTKQLSAHLPSYDLVLGFNKMPGLDLYYAADTCFKAKTQEKHGAWYRLTPRYRQLAAFEKAVFAKESKTEILLISSLQQSAFESHYQTAATRFHLLPPGICKDRVAPDHAAELRIECRKSLGIQPDEFLLLMVGSGFKTKGLDRALKGLASLPQAIRDRCRFWIAGQDNQAPFERQTHQLGITQQVTFLGGRNDIPNLLLAADLLLHPAYNENTGTILLEAVVSGLPVLTTDVCGYAQYIIQAQAGVVLTSPFQQNQFNQMLLNMLTSPERQLWKANGVNFAKTADIYSLPEQAANIIESIGTSRELPLRS